MKLNFDYKVIDDFIPKSYQEQIKNILITSREFPWYVTPDVTFGDEAKTELANPAFAHVFVRDGISGSATSLLFDALAHKGAEIAEIEYGYIHQCRSFLQLPLSEKIRKHVDPLHCDSDMDHLVVLYYVVDSDGDTILVNKKLEEGDTRELHLLPQDYTEMARVTPKQGRAVLFNGRIYHTAEQPVNNLRCVVNMNVIPK
jgi:hypothetical protein